MNLKITTPDPFNVLASTKFVLENAKSVKINEEKIKDLIKPVKAQINKGTTLATASVGSLRDYKKDCQLVLVENSVNFCFWAEKDKEKWQVEYPKGNIVNGGWFGLEACFKRSLEKNESILSAEFLGALTLDDIEKFFQSSNNITIPLLQERHKNLGEVGEVLFNKYDGQFMNLLEESSFDTIKIVKNVYENFSSFKDISKYMGEDVYFFKRAQITANDIDIVLAENKKIKIKNDDVLSAFADYKLPQILQMFGVLEYSEELAEKVDNFVLITKDSKEEVEIRAATIWGIELIRQKIPEYKSSQIDNAIWLFSQEKQKEAKPYHRTYTIYY